MQVILLPKVGYCFYDFSKIDNFMFVYYCSCVSDLGSFFVYRTNNAMLSWHQVASLSKGRWKKPNRVVLHKLHDACENTDIFRSTKI
uniref:Uncharacterized protein n=2 Tax=Lactuca sativa TaxID=4236 RepID=A0A9R1VNS6_LACSA|nr:hypothetical protein LSAT_V11C800401940 [Lactuca sativa]KAJ0208215.1 hypothetical protein LSAT_V11C500259720 [Lactuca sativa]